MKRARLSVLACGVTVLCACVAPTDRAVEEVPEIAPGVLAGYLTRESLPNSLTLLPPPHVAGSAGEVLDQVESAANLELMGQPRWTQAARDADLRFPAATTSFQCALGFPVSEEHTPTLYRLLRRSLVDAGLSTYAAKTHYQRPRPFMQNGKPTCTPDDEAQLRTDGSYPSGHAAIGWAWALILAELVPERRDVLLLRGREFGDSRAVCNVHWYSDVAAGRLVGSAAVAVLHADPVFQRDLQGARTEIAGNRAAPTPPRCGP